MTKLERFIAIEEIKRLKARYFRHLDTKNWHEFGSVFASNGTLEVGPAGVKPRKETGAAAIVSWVRGAFEGATTIHHGHMPEIEILEPRRATGIWAMDDIVIWPNRWLHGWGHYHEVYVLESDAWKIASSCLMHLRVEIHEHEYGGTRS